MAPRWPIYQAAVARRSSQSSTTPTQVPSSFLPVAPVAPISNDPDTSARQTAMPKMYTNPAITSRIATRRSFGQNHSSREAHQMHSPAPAVRSMQVVENPMANVIETQSTTANAPYNARAPPATIITSVPIITIAPPSPSSSSLSSPTTSTSEHATPSMNITNLILVAPRKQDSKGGDISKYVSWDAGLGAGSADKQQTSKVSRVEVTKVEDVKRAAKESGQRRPDTNAVVARRMIGAALGIKMPKKSDEKTAMLSRAMRLNNSTE